MHKNFRGTIASSNLFTSNLSSGGIEGCIVTAPGCIKGRDAAVIFLVEIIAQAARGSDGAGRGWRGHGRLGIHFCVSVKLRDASRCRVGIEGLDRGSN